MSRDLNKGSIPYIIIIIIMHYYMYFKCIFPHF